jgi:hypothetical protein
MKSLKEQCYKILKLFQYTADTTSYSEIYNITTIIFFSYISYLLLGLPPLHLQLEAEAKAGIYRLYFSDQWKPKSEGFGHAYMTQDMKKEPILQTGSDKMIPRHVYDKPFTIRFPDGSEWKVGFQPNRKGGLIWHTDGSKTNKGTGAGVYCHGTRQTLCFSHGQYTTVF